MIIVKCSKCGYSTFQPDGNGKITCPSCKTKIVYEDTFGNFASVVGRIVIGGIILIFIFLACVGGL